MENVQFQLDWLWNELRETPLGVYKGVSRKAYLRREDLNTNDGVIQWIMILDGRKRSEWKSNLSTNICLFLVPNYRCDQLLHAPAFIPWQTIFSNNKLK